MYIYVIFQTQRVPVDRLCAVLMINNIDDIIDIWYSIIVFQTQRVPVDRLCAIFPQQRRENRHPRLCSHVAGEQL